MVNKFPERLRELRKNNNLTTKELSNILHVSNSTLIKWENGLSVPRIMMFRKLVVFFQVKANYLIGIDD